MFTLVMQLQHSYYKAIIIKTKNKPNTKKFILSSFPNLVN